MQLHEKLTENPPAYEGELKTHSHNDGDDKVKV